MSHAGPPVDPPPPDPSQGGAGGDASGQQPYNPYPDSWAAPGGSSAPQSPYQQPSPYAEPNPYGQQPEPSAQANPYAPQAPNAGQGQPGQPGSPVNPYAGTAAPHASKPTFGFAGYASWLTRVGATLIDGLLAALTLIPAFVGLSVLGANTTTTVNPDGTETSHYSGSVAVPVALMIFSAVLYVGFYIWNVCIRQGRTGATYGKSVLAVRLVNPDLQPIGGGWAFLRSLLHVVDQVLCYLGYLWPIWDQRRQTFADKIMNTFVIHATVPQPPGYPPEPYRSA